ncbi:MAG TPA: 7-cyano-7-deazaguanine synthase QueC [Pseudomonadales bacterium]|nr:7-cyano-7-deazaguanine synthase QueC [Pseudomonadales bacterium]
MSEKAVVLLSGGLDSATTLAIAVAQGYECHCISFDYGQRHRAEITFAQRLATSLGAVEHRVVGIDIGNFGGSALTDNTIEVPVSGVGDGIPVTYVPARNTVFLAYALGFAEVLSAHEIFIGVNAVDYSGYPDCRPEFIHAFEAMANLATKAGVSGEKIHIRTPLIDLAKEDIIRTGLELGVDYGDTVSCYRLDAEGRACGVCDSCRIRHAGFEKAGIPDPTLYR